MQKFNKFLAVAALCLARSILTFLLLLVVWATPVLAHRNPVTCSGSGLGISLFTASPQVHIGDVISYDAEVFNGTSGPVVCDAENIVASIVTPDGVTHPITLIRTLLLNGQMDFYPGVITYTVRAQDVQAGILVATASDTGTIHQNDTDSTGGGFQGLNISVIVPATLHVIKTVINDNAGATVASGFNLHVKLSGVDVAGSPVIGAASPGTPYTLDPGTYIVSEDVNILYTQSFSGDCDSSGSVTIAAGEDKTCTITNDDVPPPPPPSGGGGGGRPTPPPIPTPPPQIPPPVIVVPPPVVTIIVPPPVVAPIILEVPAFPKTGFFSSGENAIWNIVVLFSNCAVFLIALYVVLKKREI